MSKRKVYWIFTLTIWFFSYAIAFLYHYIGGKWDNYPAALIILFNSFIPALVVWLIHKFVLNSPFQNSFPKFTIFNLWNLLVVLAPMVFVLIVLVFLSFFPGVELDPHNIIFLEEFKIFFDPVIFDHILITIYQSKFPIFLLNLVGAVFIGLTLNLLFAITEEIAWRGFLAYLFYDKPFITQALIQGITWSVWYAPFVAFASGINPFYAVILNTLFFILLSPLYLFVRYASKSTFTVAILHSIVTSYSYLADIVQKDYPTLWVSSYVQSIFYLLILANILLFIYLNASNFQIPSQFVEPTDTFQRKTKSVKPYKGGSANEKK